MSSKWLETTFRTHYHSTTPHDHYQYFPFHIPQHQKMLILVVVLFDTFNGHLTVPYLPFIHLVSICYIIIISRQAGKQLITLLALISFFQWHIIRVSCKNMFLPAWLIWINPGYTWFFYRRDGVSHHPTFWHDRDVRQVVQWAEEYGIFNVKQF